MDVERPISSLKMYRPTEVAAMLGVSRTALYAILMAGSLFSIKINKSRRVPEWAYREYVARLHEEALTQAAAG
jgi:hypothetical protein